MDPDNAPPVSKATTLQQACAHLDAASQQLVAVAGDDPFAPASLLAAHVSLLQAGIHPGIRALPHPSDPLSALGHVDHALRLLDAIAWPGAPTALIVWTQRLAELRPAISDLTADTGPDALTQQRP